MKSLNTVALLRALLVQFSLASSVAEANYATSIDKAAYIGLPA